MLAQGYPRVLIAPPSSFAPMAQALGSGAVAPSERARPSVAQPAAPSRSADRVDLSAGARSAMGEALSKEEQKQVDELKKRDAEVRRHEEAHQRVGGQYASAPSYEYQQGPDGKNYAVGGQVMIDTAPVEGNPDATIAKMEIVKRAALAPAEPSGQDRAVAAQADATAQAARQEKMEMDRQAADATARGEPPPDEEFQIEVSAPPSVTGAPSRTLGGYGPARTNDVGGLLRLFA